MGPDSVYGAVGIGQLWWIFLRILSIKKAHDGGFLFTGNSTAEFGLFNRFLE